MLKVNFLSDFLLLKNLIGVNGALNATTTQAKVMQLYVKVLYNNYGKEYDLIHSHGCFPYTFRLLKRGLKFKKPIIISAHTTHYDVDSSFRFSKLASHLFKLYLRRYYNFGDVVICPTENSKKIVQEELRITKPIKIISNGVNTQIFKYSIEKRNQFRHRYKLHQPTILSVGMPTKRKGFFDFIEISKKLKSIPSSGLVKERFH